MGETIENSKSLKLSICLIICLLLFSIIIRFIFLEAPLVSDDTNYFLQAEHYSVDSFKENLNQTYFRSGFLIPVAIYQHLFGYSIGTYYLSTIANFLLFILAVIFLSKIIGGNRLVIVNVLLITSSYELLNQTSLLLPDLPCLTTAIFSFTFFVLATESDKYSRIFLILSIICGFISYTIRVPNIVFLMCIPLYEWLNYKSLKKTLYYGIALLFLFLFESVIYYIITGEMFAQIKYNVSSVDSWSIYIDPITLKDYLFSPLLQFLSSITGKILFVGGCFGFLLSLYKRKWIIFSILIAGLVIFLFYSYSVTSFSPIIRALPLSRRYVLSFTFACVLCTGYLLNQIPDLLHILLKRNYISFPSELIQYICISILLLLQFIELPSLIKSQSILYDNNSYFFVDQYIKKYKKDYSDETIYCYPIDVFRLYPNINDLDLETIEFDEPFEEGDILLYSLNRIEKNIHYANKRNDTQLIELYEPFTTDYNLQFDYILFTGDLVLARYNGGNIERNKIADLSDFLTMNKYWVSQLDSVKLMENDLSNMKFLLPNEIDPYYIFTFSGNWNTTPQGTGDIFSTIPGSDVINIDLEYFINSDINSLGFFVQQYNENERIDSDSIQLISSEGVHVFNKNYKLLPDATKLRFYFRITNSENSNSELELHKFILSTINSVY